MDTSQHIALDRPIWTAITTRQRHFGIRNRFACRYRPEFAPFAALSSETDEAFDALRALMQPEEHLALLSLEPIESCQQFEAAHVGKVCQMVLVSPGALDMHESRAAKLTTSDIPEMLDLVSRTRPGPLSSRTVEMGDYFGIREDGSLVAMAGERLALDGYVEVSAVCVDSEHRGKGMAAKLISVVCSEIRKRGSLPFLHVFENNPAIGLYKRLGFDLRRSFYLTRVKARSAP